MLLNGYICALVDALASRKNCIFFSPCADRLTLPISKILETKEDEPPSLDEGGLELSDTAPRIVLILESPHVKEYAHVRFDGNENIVGAVEPARGRTGINIRKFFVPNVTKCILKSDGWRIGLINPIQYSCSFGGNLSKRTKNKLFKNLITQKAFENSFEKRLKEMCRGKYILLNCCTSKNSIDSRLENFGYKKYIKMSHPSSPSFKQQCNMEKEVEVFCGAKQYRLMLHDALRELAGEIGRK